MAYNPLNPNGQATMANSQPVVLASNQTSIPVAATLSAETTKVIGTVNQGTSPWVISGVVTVGAGSAVIGHVITDSGSTTAVTGNVTVVQATGTNLHVVTDATSTTIATQATAANLNATVVGTGTFAVQATIAAGATSFVGIEDSASTDGDAGAKVLFKRQDTPANSSGTDGDYEQPQMSAGRVWVSAKVDTALPAGSNVIGHVITDTGSTTAVTGNVTVTQATAANLNATVVGTGTFAVQATTTVVDVAPATQNITVVDSGSATASGANNQNIVTGTPTVGSVATFTLSGQETIRIQVTGTWTGTLSSETSIDGGTTWVGLGIHQGAYTTGSFTANFVGGANVSGATNYRMRATAAITGTATVKVVESLNTASTYVANAAPAGNVISVLNSSSATLLAGATYTGTAEDVSNFSEMRLSVFSDVASGTNGLSIQQSINATNWDVIDTYTIAAATGKTFVVPRQARYYRIVYTNGGTNQASFRLQSILNRTATSASSQRSQDAYSNENDLEQVWSFASVWNGTTWDRQPGTITNGTYSDLRALAGTTVSVNSGNKDAGTLRVTNATDDINLSAIKTSVELIDNAISGAGFNITQFAGGNVNTGNGASGSGTLRVSIANDSTGILATVGTVTTVSTVSALGTGTTGPMKAEDAASNTGDQGVAAMIRRKDTPVAAAQVGSDEDYLTPITDNFGAMWVSNLPKANGGLSIATGSIGNTKTDIGSANTAGQVYGWYFYNANTSVAYVQFFNAQASAVTLGTTAPVYSLGIPASAGANITPGAIGLTHSTAISIAVTTTRAGSTNTAATLDYNIFYKQ